MRIALVLFQAYLSLSYLNAAEIVKHNGHLFINGNKALKNLEVNAGDTIESKGKGSYFIVKYDDGSRFIVKEGKLIIGKLEEKAKNSSFDLVYGLMGTFIKPNEKHSFEIKRNDTVFGVRGTKFLISAKENETYLCVCDGRVNVRNKDTGVDVSRGEDLKIKNGDRKLSVANANAQMWEMARELFKELELKIPDNPKE